MDHVWVLFPHYSRYLKSMVESNKTAGVESTTATFEAYWNRIPDDDWKRKS
jgi:hypothetical protein